MSASGGLEPKSPHYSTARALKPHELRNLGLNDMHRGGGTSLGSGKMVFQACVLVHKGSEGLGDRGGCLGFGSLGSSETPASTETVGFVPFRKVGSN